MMIPESENRMFDLKTEMGLEQGMTWTFRALILGTIAVIFFGAGLFYAMHAHGAERTGPRKKIQQPKTMVVRGKQEVDFEGLAITGELRNPGEFYFQRKTDEKFDTLVKRRKNFHREMLRDVVMAK
jgi:hypothetical protein